MRRWMLVWAAAILTGPMLAGPPRNPSVIGAGPLSGTEIGNGIPTGSGSGATPPNCTPGGTPGGRPVVVVPGIWWGGGYGWGPGYPYGYGYSPYYNDPLLQQNYLLQQQNVELQRQRLQAEQERLDAAARERIEQLRQKNNRDKARTAQRAGVRHFATGNYKLAADRFRDAASYDAESSQPQLLLGQTYFAQKRYSDAARAVRNGLRLNPNAAVLADVNVPGLYAKPDVFQTQLASLAAALQANPLDRDGMFLFGYMLFQTGERASAKTIFEQVAKMDAADAGVTPFIEHFAKRDAATGANIPTDPSTKKL